MSSYIQFQVWRPSGRHSGCYSLVGLSEPPDRGLLTPADSVSESLAFLRPLISNSSRVRRKGLGTKFLRMLQYLRGRYLSL